MNQITFEVSSVFPVVVSHEPLWFSRQARDEDLHGERSPQRPHAEESPRLVLKLNSNIRVSREHQWVLCLFIFWSIILTHKIPEPLKENYGGGIEHICNGCFYTLIKAPCGYINITFGVSGKCTQI